MRPHGAPLAAISCLLLMCNELAPIRTHGACSTASLLHVRGMLALDLACFLHSWWQVLRGQRRPDDLIDLGCRCSALPLTPPRWCLAPVDWADRAMCLAGRLAARTVRS